MTHNGYFYFSASDGEAGKEAVENRRNRGGDYTMLVDANPGEVGNGHGGFQQTTKYTSPLGMEYQGNMVLLG